MSQKGFSLLEMTVALAVASVMLSVLTTIVYRAAQGLDKNNSQMGVYREIENAVAFIGGDVNMTKYTDLAEGASVDLSPSVGVSLEWTDFYQDANRSHRVYYYLSATGLMRDYDGVVTKVGKSISSATFSRGTTAAGTGNLITVTLTASATEGPVQTSETKTFKFYLRPQQ